MPPSHDTATGIRLPEPLFSRIEGRGPSRGFKGQSPLALLAFLGLLALATGLCVVFVDRPVALWCMGHQRYRTVFQLCAAPSLLALPAAGVFLGYAAVRRLRHAGGVSQVWLAASVAVLAGTAVKDELKWWFGRPWPWAWLQYHDYRFHPFVDSVMTGSFPSGHTAYISAPLCVLWVLLPRWRVVWGGVIGLVMIGLVAANYHFVADVLAGLWTGVVSAWGTLVLMKRADE